MEKFSDKLKVLDLKTINEISITTTDIMDFANSYEKLKKLLDSYSSSYSRKQAANEIREKIAPIQTFLWIVKNKLLELDKMFEYLPHFVNDYEMAMNLLLRLANNGSNKYVLKKFHSSDCISFESEQSDIRDGNIWIISQNDIIKNIPKKNYFSYEFGIITTELVKAGFPIIILTDHHFPINILSSAYCGRLERFSIKVSGFFSDITCFVYDDELMLAVTKFRAWLAQNGGDIKGLNEDILFDLIQNI